LLLFTIDNTGPKYGFKLWNYPKLCYSLEFLLFFGSYYYYLINTEKIQIDQSKDITSTNSNNIQSQNYWTRNWSIILLLDSLFTFISGIIPPPENYKLLGIIMLCLYCKITYLSHKLDKVRISKHNKKLS
jgi:hypothetical protein